MISGSEPAGITGVSDHERRHHRTHPIDVSQRGVSGGDFFTNQCLGGFDIPIQAADIGSVRFAFKIAFDTEAKSYEGESEVELRDDLIARMAWLAYEQVN